MDYRLGVERYGRFQNLYLRQGRALHEQVLNLSPEDVRALAAYLEWNAQPENATYAYDFFRDNCATKVIAVLTEVFGSRFMPIARPQTAPTSKRFGPSRRAIHGRLGAWNSSLGQKPPQPCRFVAMPFCPTCWPIN